MRRWESGQFDDAEEEEEEEEEGEEQDEGLVEAHWGRSVPITVKHAVREGGFPTAPSSSVPTRLGTLPVPIASPGGYGGGGEAASLGSYGGSFGSIHLGLTPSLKLPTPLYQPLSFPLANKPSDPPPPPFECVCCDFDDYDSSVMMQHMSKEHHIVVAEVEKVADLASYLKWWRANLEEKPLSVWASRMTVPPEQVTYYVLSDTIPDDKNKRQELQQHRLAALINRQQAERLDHGFHRRCLFCKKVFHDRAGIFRHMYVEHKFNVGHQDNLVNVAALLDMLESKVDNLQCLYCEKTFKSYAVLKLHMRKKKHFKIDPKNHDYDRFYLVNYLEPGKDWELLAQEEESIADESDESGEEEEEIWSDWTDEGEEDTQCLFCSHVAPNPQASLEHARTVHEFDLNTIRKEHYLDFYKAVKLINYLRRRVFEKGCPRCDAHFETGEELLEHMTTEAHFMPRADAAFWSDPQYLLSTYDNDPLISGFDTEFEDDEPPSMTEEDVFDLHLHDIPSEVARELQSIRVDVHETIPTSRRGIGRGAMWVRKAGDVESSSSSPETEDPPPLTSLSES